MPIIVSHFRANHKDLGKFLLSGQLRDAVRQGAKDVAAIARASAGITKIRDHYGVEPGPDVVITKNGNPRLSERVVNDHPAAAADEFGSGSGNKGKSGGKARREGQGGGSPAFRTLGQAGARIADRLEDTD